MNKESKTLQRERHLVHIDQLRRPLKELAVDLGDRVKLKMVLIPAGEFMMGSPDSDKDAFDSEKPQHRVRITKPFYLGRYPVTQEQWEAVMGSEPIAAIHFPCTGFTFAEPTLPAVTVSWNDCQDFLERLNDGLDGGNFSLPTEAQWEYACRAGSTTRYSFGDEESGLGKHAWYAKNFDNPTSHVGRKKPNAWGLYDMHGNVCEWCADWYDEGYYAKSPTDDPTGPATGSDRVLRGGSWHDPAQGCRSAHRYGNGPEDGGAIMGLRVVRVPAE